MIEQPTDNAVVEKPIAAVDTTAAWHVRDDGPGFERRPKALERRVRAALPWVGLLIVFALSSYTTDQAGRAPTLRNWVFGRLNREHTFGQTFVVERDELVAVRVLLFANPTTRDDPVTLRLRPIDRALPDVAVVTLPLHDLAHHGMTTFAFSPLTLTFLPRQVTTTLQIDLEAPTLTPPDWITVMAGPDSYSGGEILADGASNSAADLAFQPIYRRRWFDILLPVTRMAYGKPGILGWPQLYALIGYSYCLILARMLFRLWRAVHSAVDAR